MSLTKEQVCVFIENEEQLQAAKDLLEKYKEPIYEFCFFLSIPQDAADNFLQFFDGVKGWSLTYQLEQTQITLSELETILKK